MPYGLVMDWICGMREREVVVRMGEVVVSFTGILEESLFGMEGTPLL